jgi:hypothetical protein
MLVQGFLGENRTSGVVLWEADGQAAICLLPASRLQRSADERQVGDTGLSCGKLMDKPRYVFSQLADSNGQLMNGR